MTENLDVFLNDFGVTVTFGALTFKGILDTPDDIIGGGVAISTEYTLTVKSSSIATLEELNLISIGGENYKVRSIRKLNDGSFSSVTLSKVIP